MLSFQDQIGSLGVVLKTIFRNARGIKVDPEVNVLEKLIPPGAVCFDIGAAYGRYALRMAKSAGESGQVYCFEPAEQSYRALRLITAFYGLKNVTLVKKALSREPGSGMLALPIKKPSKIAPGIGHSLAHLITDSDTACLTHPVSVTTIDDYVAEVKPARLDFIKCDVEGAELLVFEGGRETIKCFEPVVLCEVYKTWLQRFHTTPAEILNFFSGMGYKIFALQDQIFCEIETIEEDRNYFFIHKSRGGF